MSRSRMEYDDGYVEDSEGEESMSFDLSVPMRRNPAPGLPPPPRLPPAIAHADETVSTIQTANTSAFPTRPVQPVHSPQAHQDTTVSTIQTANFSVDRSVVSDISSFGPEIHAHNHHKAPSTIQTASSIPRSEVSSISTSTSASVSARPKPRPRPVKRAPDASASAVLTSIPSSDIPSSTSTPFPYIHSMLPPPVPIQPPASSASSSFPPTATTVLATPRVSDSGVEMDDLASMDIAERAKMRSRARSQAKGKQISYQEEVIELSSSDDELAFLPSSKAKSRPKPKKATSAKQSSEKGQDKAKSNSKAKSKTKDSSKPSPTKRPKTAHVVDGFESDVNTIPVPTSDFPPDHHHPSSQLPPSDPPPPPSTAGSSSVPRTSQDLDSLNDQAARRDDSPLSSPPPPLPRKRKRSTARPSSLDGDFGFGEDEEGVFMARADAVPAAAQKAPQKKKGKELPPPPIVLIPPFVPSPDVVPETQLPEAPTKAKAKAKPAAPRKRKSAEEDEEEWAGDVPPQPQPKPAKGRKKARTEEDDEEEWAGGAPSKAKPKRGAKKAAAKDKAPKEKPKKGRANAKDKLPTSKEVIDDSDMEADAGKNVDQFPVSSGPSKEKASEPAVENGEPREKTDCPAPSKKGKGKQRNVVLSDDEDVDATNADVSTNNISIDDSPRAPVAQDKGGRKSSSGEVGSKENDVPAPPKPTSALPSSSSSSPASLPKPAARTLVTPNPGRSSFANSNRAYTIGAKNTKGVSMSELIRRASAQPGSPFPVPSASQMAYSPLAKASKSMLRRIAPLHPNRRTPPPPPPRPPPKPKTKKMLELEEKWEMELEDSVEGWYAMPEQERAALRRAKRDHELGFED